MKTSIKNSELNAIIHHKGAELISLKSDDNREYIWEGNPEFWGKHSPVLFPIVGTLKNNHYLYNDKEYHLLRHGFARDVNFELIKQTENQAVFSLKANDETKKVYPFDFELQLTYTLDENKIVLTYTVTNNDDVAIPFSLGAHPAFALPKSFENYALQFEKSEHLVSYQLDNDLLSNKTFEIQTSSGKLPLSYSLFEKDALIFKKLNSKKISILENTIPILTLECEDFPHLGIWTKKNAPFLCLEPWLGYSDAVTCSGNILEKEAIQIVEVNEVFECQFTIEILATS